MNTDPDKDKTPAIDFFISIFGPLLMMFMFYWFFSGKSLKAILMNF